MEIVDLKPSEELAYWVGAIQTDGSLKIYTNKKTGHTDVRVSMHVATSSLPMVKKVQEISKKILKRSGNIWKERTKPNWPFQDTWEFHIAIKSLLATLNSLNIIFGDPPRPPNWCLENNNFFGAYLAGIIDGDGTIKIHGKKYPQCHIKVTSGHEQTELAQAVKSMLNCWVRVYSGNKISVLNNKIISGKFADLEFYCSNKNHKFFKEFVIPKLMLECKKEKLCSFIKMRFVGREGDLNPS